MRSHVGSEERVAGIGTVVFGLFDRDPRREDRAVSDDVDFPMSGTNSKRTQCLENTASFAFFNLF